VVDEVGPADEDWLSRPNSSHMATPTAASTTSAATTSAILVLRLPLGG
jgi:hypothetical protein